MYIETCFEIELAKLDDTFLLMDIVIFNSIEYTLSVKLPYSSDIELSIPTVRVLKNQIECFNNEIECFNNEKNLSGTITKSSMKNLEKYNLNLFNLKFDRVLSLEIINDRSKMVLYDEDVSTFFKILKSKLELY